MSGTEESHAVLLDDLAALDPPQRRELAEELRQVAGTSAGVPNGALVWWLRGLVVVAIAARYKEGLPVSDRGHRARGVPQRRAGSARNGDTAFGSPLAKKKAIIAFAHKAAELADLSAVERAQVPVGAHGRPGALDQPGLQVLVAFATLRRGVPTWSPPGRRRAARRRRIRRRPPRVPVLRWRLSWSRGLLRSPCSADGYARVPRRSAAAKSSRSAIVERLRTDTAATEQAQRLAPIASP